MNRRALLMGWLATAAFASCTDENLVDSTQLFDAAGSRVEVDRATGVVADGIDAALVTVVVRDLQGRAMPGVRVELGVAGDAVAFEPLPETDDDGLTRTTMTSTRAQFVTLTASVEGVAISARPTVEFIPGAAQKLAFIAFPGAAQAGAVLSPAVRVEVRDAEGNRATDAETSISLHLEGGSPDATLLGETTARVVEGVAAFDDLRIAKAGVGYRLVARCEGLTDLSSPSFDVTVGPPAALSFVAGPVDGVAGETLPPVVVELLDAQGNRLLDATQPVTLALGSAATLEGEVSVAPAEGLATFSQLVIRKARADHTLIASATGFASSESAPFGIAPAEVDDGRTGLVASPESAAADGEEMVTVSIAVSDAFGNPVAQVPVTLSSNIPTDAVAPASGATNDAGAFTATLQSTKAGARTITANIGSSTKTQTVTFVAGAPDAERSTVSVSPARVPADGTTVAIVAVTVVDAFDNPVEAATVVLEVTDAPNAVAQPGPTGSDGKTSGTVASTRAGTKSVRATANGVVLRSFPEVLFNPLVRVGGTVTGLREDAGASTGLVVTLDDGESLDIDANGRFAFATPVEAGTSYAVGISSQPAGQACTIIGRAGIAPDVDVDDVQVKCGPRWVMLAAGASARHTLGLQADGSLWAWGSNSDGQLGDGGTELRGRPVRVGAHRDFISLAGSEMHALAVKSNGTLWAWGTNSHGQLGNDTTTAEQSPVRIGSGTTWASVAAGRQHSLGIKTDGTLWGWGRNDLGQLGDGTPDVRREPVRIGTRAGFKAVAAGREHSLALQSDGTLWAWGQNDAGQLGDGTTNVRREPVRIGTGFKAVAAGMRHTVALKTDGTLWAWGQNDAGQLGDGTTTDQPTPVLVGTGYASVAAGGAHTTARKTDGSTWAWGRNKDGQLGDGTRDDRTRPVRIGGELSFELIGAGASHTFALEAQGTLWAWGDNGYGQLGDGRVLFHPTPMRVGPEVVRSVAGGNGSTAAIWADGTLWTWGLNDAGQLGQGDTLARGTPARVGGDFLTVALGFKHGVAVKTDGTLWAWGKNTGGQLGDGTADDRFTPRQVGSSFASVTAGAAHTLALRPDGALWGWGDNSSGQLGDGTTNEHRTPTDVAASFTSIATGGSHSIGLKSDESLWGWGSNFRGQVGDGSGNTQTSPVHIGDGFVALSAGYSHSAALHSDETLWLWGSNVFGQLGTGDQIAQARPQRLDGRYVSVAAGQYHTLAVRTDGSLWAWGANQNGQLGDGTTTDRLVPVRIGVGFKSVAAGYQHSLGIKTDGTLWAWGDNSFVQLGLGEERTRLLPVFIP